MIDEEYLAQQTAGDTDLQHELLTLFLQQLAHVRNILDPHPAGSALPPIDLPHALHRIRGAAAAVGARELVRSFSQMEQGMDRQPPSPVVLGTLRAEVDAACLALRGLIAARRPAGLAKGGESR